MGDGDGNKGDGQRGLSVLLTWRNQLDYPAHTGLVGESVCPSVCLSICEVPFAFVELCHKLLVMFILFLC